MTVELRQGVTITADCLDAINAIFLDPESRVTNDFLEVIARYGTPEEINQKARQARELPNLLAKVREKKPEYLEDLRWLEEQRDRKAFISIAEYRRKVLGNKADAMEWNEDCPVTLEVSAAQYFPWVILAARRAIEEQTLMPGRFIRVRKMKEQEADGDLPAFAAAMQIIGASYVETHVTIRVSGVQRVYPNFGADTITEHRERHRGS